MSTAYLRNIYVAKIIRKNETTLHKRGRIVTLGNKLQKNGFISTNGSIFAAKSEKMKHTSIILYTMVIVTLAASTLLGRIYGTEFVENEIYHAAWFFLMWTLTAIAATTTLVKSKIWKKPYTALLHLSFLMILVGAATTFFTGTKGYMHISPGKDTNYFTDIDNGSNKQLPFAMQLDSFVVKYYNNTEVPADYISYIKIDGTPYTISMNKILKKDGYRFYQSSYDKDGGSMLSVSHDPYGNAITYAGYTMLIIASCLSLLSKRESFRKLLKHPSLRRGTTLMLLVFLCCANMQARATSTDSLARKQVLYKGRIAPFDTQARDFLKKLSGRDSYNGLTAVQVIRAWQQDPKSWHNEPIIRIKNQALRKKLGINDEYATLSQLYNEKKEYKLQKILEKAKGDNKQQAMIKSIFETDEKAGMILMMLGGTLVKELPDDGSVKPLSDAAIMTEIIYNKLPVTKIMFMGNLTLGIIAFMLLLAAMLRGATGTIKKCRGAMRILLYANTIILAASYITRWYIGGRVPLSNGYETMIFMALSILIISCFIEKRFSFALVGGFLLSGFTLLVAHLGEMNPQITPLMPVLVSPLLSIHVSLIMIAYALFAFIMLGGIVALIAMRSNDKKRQESVEAITTLSRLLLYPAVLFLGIGIFIGAVWANVSWGRYWAWDPKEVWALITFMIYGAAFHTASVEKFRDKRFFHIYMIAAFATVVITYFGVNYLLGGMHSYANINS